MVGRGSLNLVGQEGAILSSYHSLYLCISGVSFQRFSHTLGLDLVEKNFLNSLHGFYISKILMPLAGLYSRKCFSHYALSELPYLSLPATVFRNNCKSDPKNPNCLLAAYYASSPRSVIEFAINRNQCLPRGIHHMKKKQPSSY